MAVDIVVPTVGESVAEGRIARWVKKSGESVKEGEILIELETDKATAEVTAPASGVVQADVPEGTMVQIGAVVGKILPSNGAAAPAPKAAPSAPPAAAKPAAAAPVPIAEPVDGPPLSPAARRVVAENHLDPNNLTGSARGGVVTKEDALKAVQASSAPAAAPVAAPAPAKPAPAAPAATPAPATASGDRVVRQPMSMIRRTIAARLVQAQQTTASLTTFNEVDMSAIMDLRTKYKDKFKERHKVGLGFMSFFVKAAIEALKAFPMVNARIDGSDVVLQNFYDIGVAVSTERGLVVPVIRNADAMSYAGIEQAIVDVATKARDNKISIADMSGGTFTITNGGIFGSMLSTPILNTPQSAILGMHNIVKRAVVVDDQIVIHPMMYLALTYDHRIIDGKEAVQFLVRIKDCVENPERMLLSI
ncbi:2-oxoglutarate dehydrogenase complex dihydrolipoyllysine-residue succinyltransferase [Tuwongella immobilis]|uniref:Dihydrolipoyllysine-residue succinyltransferase component of 2-oxoglutarate dehydrogenase complex n=1 Tax=Tuwongella immobilis TaxID=692036 RepID=A0A6C2YU67_9BACT|nr:2-oxoglutarate dehydrogenase complex dihydrolipoyllysine-residue succinyltransferase [Tuwongella immobilis]VIP04683.1 dihydrolipoyllysine-residue e2 component of oxoglutarate dehydrogenase (succinyl-transferring) complex : Dihydrolipoyllysine-residue succinyltransferase component of 2-oxoglutarate dehydrogenase complex OS=Leptospira terpstrae serovar Hualin str. LT 11-33 = ATCC 700639 GN=sucB PE=3 SV=1: Biotin_lipoyl: E3_binding: 2-oxoacid_dh [Tuwongella immobilis]VTS06725.1 dihydrolipoyllysin